MLRKWIIIAGVGCLIALGAVWLPIPAQTVHYQTANGWQMVLKRPLFLRAGEGGQLALAVSLPEGAAPGVVRARLDVVGLSGEGSETGEVVGAGANAHFDWAVGTDRAGRYSGRLWVYAGEDKALVNARPLDLLVVGPVPVILWALRIFLLVGALLCGAFSLNHPRQQT